jgi:hypothetical protein
MRYAFLRAATGRLRPNVHPAFRGVLGLASAVLLSACATAPILKEDAGAIVATTKVVVAEARGFYTRLSEKRVNYLLRTLATSKHCTYGWPAVLLRDETEASGWRCLEPDETRLRMTCIDEPALPECSSTKAREVGNAVRFDLGPTRYLAALALMDAMTEYTVALARVVADPALDSKAELTQVAERIATVRGLLDALQNEDATKLDLGKEIAAAGALLDLVRQAAEDQRDLEALRVLLREKGPAFEASLAALANEYQRIHTHIAMVLDARQLGEDVARLRKRLPTLNEEARVKAMQAVATAEIAFAARAAAPDALAEAFQKLYQAHVELRVAALEGKYTDEQRKRMAAATMQRLTAWFAAIRDLLVLI